MAGEQQALSSLQLVAFRDVLDNVVQQAHAELQQLAERLPAVGDEERWVCCWLSCLPCCRPAPMLRRAAPKGSSSAPHRLRRRRRRLRLVLPPTLPPPCLPLPAPSLQQAPAAAAPADHAAAAATPARVRAVGAQGKGGQHVPGGSQGVTGPWRSLCARGWVLPPGANAAPHDCFQVLNSNAEALKGAAAARCRCCGRRWGIHHGEPPASIHDRPPLPPAADELFRLNEELRFCRAPLFDVSFALHIMQTGKKLVGRQAGAWVHTPGGTAAEERTELSPIAACLKHIFCCRHLPPAAQCY